MRQLRTVNVILPSVVAVEECNARHLRRDLRVSIKIAENKSPSPAVAIENQFRLPEGK